MATYQEVSLPLYTDFYYSYTAGLENNTYTLDFKYNSWGKKWFLSIFDEDGNALIESMALVPKYGVGRNFIIPGLSGFFWLYPIPSITSDKYTEAPEDIAQYYTLSYIYNWQE